MKVTVVKKNDNQKLNLISNIIMIVLGFILFLNANQLITTIFIILGVVITGFSCVMLLNYFKTKKQFNTDDNQNLVGGVLGIAIGLLTVLLASILSNAIQIISGIWLLIVGLNKLTIYLQFKTSNIDILLSILLILLGIYTIFFDNAVLNIIGMFLIITAVYDIINQFKTNKK